MADLYLYRVEENDDEGDPLDHGIVRANSREQAEYLVRNRLARLGLNGVYTVRFYEQVDTKVTLDAHLVPHYAPGVLNDGPSGEEAWFWKASLIVVRLPGT